MIAMRDKMTFPSIAVFAVYFGPLPAYFQLWLDSCGYNRAVDWLLFVDADVSRYDIPPNVLVRRSTLVDLSSRVGLALGIELAPSYPYKFCDFRPALWVLLSEEGKKYDFWGHCDLDMIFGNLNVFLTEDMFSNYDKIFTVGHFTLYRNATSVNKMFEAWHPEMDWREVMADPRHRGFDEHIGVNRIWRAAGARMLEREEIIANIDPHIERFERAVPSRNYRRQLFYFERGHVLRTYLAGAEWRIDEFMYIHFQKRNMTCLPAPGATRYAIAPGGFFDMPDHVSASSLTEQLNPFHFRPADSLHRLRSTIRSWRRSVGLGPRIPSLRCTVEKNP